MAVGYNAKPFSVILTPAVDCPTATAYNEVLLYVVVIFNVMLRDIFDVHVNASRYDQLVYIALVKLRKHKYTFPYNVTD